MNEFSCYIDLDTFSRRIHFLKLTYNKVISTRSVFEMNLFDSSICLFCHKEETVVHAFLECKMLLDCGGAFTVG